MNLPAPSSLPFALFPTFSAQLHEPNSPITPEHRGDSLTENEREETKQFIPCQVKTTKKDHNKRVRRELKES